MQNLKVLFLKCLDFDLEDSNNYGHPFYDNYQKVLLLDSETVEYKYLFFNCLFGIIEYLETFKKSSPQTFEHWKNRLKNNTKNVGLYSDIFEIYILWSLNGKGISFVKRERPDFEISYNDNKIFIECGSAQFEPLSNPTQKSIFTKLKKVIKTNYTSGYLTSSSALFIDITNLIFHSNQINCIINTELLLKALMTVSRELTYDKPEKIGIPGAITFMNFEYFMNDSGQNFGCNIVANFINPIFVDSNLSTFLENEFIPKIEQKDIYNPKFNH